MVADGNRNLHELPTRRSNPTIRVRKLYDQLTSRRHPRRGKRLLPPQPSDLGLGGYVETLPCQARLVEAGEGQLYKGDNSTTLRVRDPNKQLDFIYTPATIEVCSTIGNRSTYHAVLGMKQVAITVRILPNKTASTDYVRYIGRDRQGNPVNMTSNLTWAEIEYASHTQYSRDLATAKPPGKGNSESAV